MSDENGSPPEDDEESPESEIRERTSTRNPSTARVIATSTLAGTVIALAGGALIAASSDMARYGVTLFVALPILIGLIAGCLVRPGSAVLLTVILSVALSFLVLLFTGLEGVICICMATPLILAGAAAGAGLGWLIRRTSRSKSNLALLPLLGVFGVFGVGAAEDRLAGSDRSEPVTSVFNLDATPEEVWTAILANENVLADRPFLLRIGLPVPVRCTLEGTGVDAIRTCHFDSGVIEEKVTVWEPAQRLEMRVVRSTLPGRHWLGFQGASYTIEQTGPGQVRVTRTTTITSKLRPAFYWRTFERWGVDAEHAYVFESLTSVLKKRRG